MSVAFPQRCTVFAGSRHLAAGTVEAAVLAARAALHGGEEVPVLVFDDATGRVFDFDPSGSEEDVLMRVRAHARAARLLAAQAAPGQAPAATPAASVSAEASLGEASLGESSLGVDPAEASSTRGRGRPRLGVIAREVTLLPRHWDWLATQPGGASVALRRLVDEARKAYAGRDRQRQAEEATYHFITAVGGDLPGYEEVTRALFTHDVALFAQQMSDWPEDVRRYALRLLQGAMADGPVSWAAAIIDMDGTLVDTLGDFEVAINSMLSELGLAAVGRDFIERTVGKGTEYLIRQTLQQVGADAARFEQAHQAYLRHYAAVNGRQARVYAGVEAGLQALQAAGVPLVCVTNKPGRFAEPLLQQLGLARYFRAIYGGDAFARKKPDPMPLLKACETLGTTPAQTLMVGDSSNDVLAARAAGCPVVLVNYGYNHGVPAEQAGADRVVAGLDQLLSPI